MTTTSFLHHAFAPLAQGLQGLDSYLSSFSSSTRSLSWSRVWEKTSSQVQIVRDMLTEIAHKSPAGSIFADRRIEAIKISCEDSSSWFSSNPLGALNTNDLSTCQIELIEPSGSAVSQDVLTLLSQGKENPTSFSLLRVLKLLTTGDGSVESTRELLNQSSYRSLTDQLGHEEMRTSALGGRFSSTYSASVSSVYQKIVSFFYPALSSEDLAAQSKQSVTLSTTCKILPTDIESLECSHTLSQSGHQFESLKVYNHPSAKEIYDQNGWSVQSWNSQLRALGLISSTSTTKVSGGFENEKKMTLYPTLWSQITSFFPTLRMPVIDSWVSLLAIPAGIGITIGGLIYTKDSLQDEKKSPLRKGAAIATGLATTILGIGVALVPFKPFSQ